MARRRDPTSDDARPQRAALRFSAGAASRLAHWPPPFRSVEAKAVLQKNEPASEPKRAKPRGWRLTRSIFSEFSDD